ncbi:MAG TPA: hypothetical protein VFP21_09285 [Solirubrobacterales bacterium]|nr:hypothetical protein [Solirubrobacterales bacterium]
MTTSQQDNRNEEPTPKGTAGTRPEKKLDLSKLPRRDALNCTVDELVATSWE